MLTLLLVGQPPLPFFYRDVDDASGTGPMLAVVFRRDNWE
jgi:hypothetical protein